MYNCLFCVSSYMLCLTYTSSVHCSRLMNINKDILTYLIQLNKMKHGR